MNKPSESGFVTSALDHGDLAVTMWDRKLQINRVGGTCITLTLEEARVLYKFLSSNLRAVAS